jgi:hypothetical protein
MHTTIGFSSTTTIFGPVIFHFTPLGFRTFCSRMASRRNGRAVGIIERRTGGSGGITNTGSALQAWHFGESLFFYVAF